MKHKYSSSEMFCPICECSMRQDDDASVFHQKVSRNTNQQKSNFLLV